MNFHFDLGVCVHTSADLRPTVHMFEKVVSYITAGAVEYTALHANVRAVSHAPLAVPAHTAWVLSHFHQNKAGRVPLLSLPPAVLFNKSLSAHLLSTYARMCLFACAAGS